MIYLLGIIPFAILIGVVLSRWRLGVILIFVWLLLEDLIRRLIPGQPSQIMLIKDFLIALTYFSFLLVFIFKNKKIWKPAFGGSLFLLVAFIVINILNPNSPGLLFGLIGLRSYFWYLPLIFLGYYMFNSQEKLLKFCKFLAYLSIPLFLFVIFQFIFFKTGWALVRPFATATQTHSFQIATDLFKKSGEMPFLSSVFGMGQRYSRFSMLLFFLSLGLLATKFSDNSLAPRKNKVLLVMAIFSAFLGIILSSTRTAFVLSIVGALIFFVFAIYKKNNKIYYFWKNNKIIISSFTLILIVSLVVFFFLENSAFFQLSGFYTAFQERIPWVSEGFRSALMNAKLFGMGTGTFSQGLYEISGGKEWINQNKEILSEGFRFETGFGKIIFELGIFGMITFYLFWISLFYQMKKEIKSLKNSNLRNLGLGILLFSFLMLFWFTFIHNQVLGDATTLVILWFFLGVFFSLNKIANHELSGDSGNAN